MDEIDIRPEVRELAKKLGVPVKNVQSISITGDEAVVETLRLDADKNTFIDPQTNQLATDSHTFVVRTP